MSRTALIVAAFIHLASCGAKRAKRTRESAWSIAFQEHLAQRAVAPRSTPREAYVTMWWGDTSSLAFNGLKVMMNSVRQFDTSREIVIMTPVPEDRLLLDDPIDPTLLQVARAFAPASTLRVPFLTIFKQTNKTCSSMSLGGCGMAITKSYAGSRTAAKNKYDSYLYSYTKFALWNMTAFTQLMYIDNDVLVTQSLDALWATPLNGTRLAAASLTIRARTWAGMGEPRCNGDGTVPRGVIPRSFNAGVHMMQPSAILYAAIRHEMAHQWRYSFKTPCTGDQRYWNILLAKNHMHCWPLSANCRDPQFIEQPSPPDASSKESRLSRCLEAAPDASGVRKTMATPYMVHMACHSKPWLPSNAKSFFTIEWNRHLQEVNRKLARSAR